MSIIHKPKKYQVQAMVTETQPHRDFSESDGCLLYEQFLGEQFLCKQFLLLW